MNPAMNPPNPRAITGRFLCAALALCAAGARADAVLEYEGASAACHGDFARLAVSGLSVRVDSPPPLQDHSFIYDAAEKSGIALDHARKQIFEMEFDDDAIDFQGDVMKSASNMAEHKMEKAQAQAAAACAQAGRPCVMPPPSGANGMVMPQIDPKQIEAMMQQNLARMTPEQRKSVEQSLKNLRESGYGGLAGPAAMPVVEATGERRDVNGIACAVERVTLDGELLREDCRVDGFDGLALDAADLKRLQRTFQRMQKFTSTVRDNARFATAAMKRNPDDGRRLLVARRCFDGGRPSGDVTLRVRSDAAPADWFAVPAGYSRMQAGETPQRDR